MDQDVASLCSQPCLGSLTPSPPRFSELISQSACEQQGNVLLVLKAGSLQAQSASMVRWGPSFQVTDLSLCPQVAEG